MTIALLFFAYGFKVIGIDSAACGPPLVRALSAVPGVQNVKVDIKSGLVTLDVPEGFDKAKLREAVVNAGFETEGAFAPLPPDAAFVIL